MRFTVSVLVKITSLGLLTALAAWLVGISSYGQHLEEEVGLVWLFTLRGPRPAPPEVVVVSMDRESSDHLGLDNEPRKWPRSLHARLVRNLVRHGARVIAFDVLFDEHRDPADDSAFSEAVRAAGNVVLCKKVRRRNIALDDTDGRPIGGMAVESLIPPIPELAAAAAALAPFPLPTIRSRVSQFWLFKPEAGDVPTLPVAAMQVMARPARARLLRSLRASTSGFSRYLDFYGPPRTITTIPYYKVLALDEDPAALGIDLSGKAVFVGFSEKVQPEQEDAHYTVFSQEDGLDLSGVEIVATAFANLLENRFVIPVSPGMQALLLALWGISIALAFCLLPVPSLPVAVVVLAGAYLGLAERLFGLNGTWLPLAVPLLWQGPTVLFGALIWRYRDAQRERRQMRETFAYYLPPAAIDILSREGVHAPGRRVHGICLFSDARGYTALSERVGPEHLHAIMNRYYEALFALIRRRGGFISDVQGDGMLALWATRLPDRHLRETACLAALEITDAMERLDLGPEGFRLPTRIALHCGHVVLGNVGAADHFEYRAVGDIVNASSRLQALNKDLGTRILASQEMLEGIGGFTTRALGRFLLRGKTVPIALHELMGRADQADAERAKLCEQFAQGLGMFQGRRWDEAAGTFRALIAEHGEDGPSRYFLCLSERNSSSPPEAAWSGVVVVP